MAFSSIGLRGQGVSNASSTSLDVAVATAAITVGSFVLINVALNNSSTADGDNSEVASVTDARGNTWTKYGEYTNSQGVAGDGVTNSVWGTIVTTQLEIADLVTVTLNTAVDEKRAGLYAFGIAGSVTVVNDATPVTSEVTAAADFGSAAHSGLASAERLYFRGMAKLVNATTALTPTVNFTNTGENGRSGNTANAVINRSEFRINTSTGETSNPTLADAGDTASVFLALAEQAAASGSLLLRLMTDEG